MGIFVYVGNLDSSTTEAELRAAFVAGGTPIQSVSIQRSSQNDRSRGFGFVELASSDEAEAAIRTMNGVELAGRPLKVSAARERPSTRPQGSSFQSYSGLGGRTPGGPRRPGGEGARHKRR